MLSRSRWIQSAALVAVIAASAFGFGHSALAIQDSEDKVWFGPVGIAQGEAGRVNVYVIGNPDIAPWEFMLRIYDRRGVVTQEERFRVAPGTFRSVDIAVQDEENFPVDRLGRRTMRAEIVGFNPQPDPPGTPRTSGYSASFEIFSVRTGRTNVVLGGFDSLAAAAITQ